VSIRRRELPHERDKRFYTEVPNSWARDVRLSRKARGLLTELLSHQVGWECTLETLQEGGPEGREALRSGVKELVEVGYLTVVKSRGEGGKFVVDYDLSAPHEAPEPVDNYQVGKPDVVAEPVDNTGYGNGLSASDNPSPKEDHFKNQLTQSPRTTDRAAVDNSRVADDEVSSGQRLGWAARRRARRSTRELDVDALADNAGDKLLEQIPELDRRRIMLQLAHTVLSYPAAKGESVTAPTAYVVKAFRTDPEVWRKRAFELWETS